MTDRTQRARGNRTLLLAICLLSLYLITYSARIETGDTRLFFDAVSSLVDHGDTRIDLMAWFRFPVSDFALDNALPLQDARTEPLQIVLGGLVYFAAKAIPGIGLVHALWLFNIVICTAAACVLYRYVLLLQYHERTALLAALLFGAFTLIFPYTRTFFREPIALFCLLYAAFALEKWRASGYHQPGWGVIAGGFVIGMILSKASMLMAIPALAIIALPNLKFQRGSLRFALLTALALVGLLVILSAAGIGGDRYNILRRLTAIDGDYFWTALSAYVFSPGGSIWATSPVLLLAIPGVWRMIRTRRWRYAAVWAVLTMALAVGYALLSHAQWFGGLSLPPRFLLPLIPFWMLAALPVLERLNGKRLNSAGVLVIGLIAFSLWVQLSGVTLTLEAYPDALPPESNHLIEWSGGLYDPRYFRWVVIPSLWRTQAFDFAWRAVDLPAWGIGFGALTAGGVVALLIPRLARRMTVVILGGAWLIGVFFGLRSLYALDWRYLAGDDSLFDAMQVLEQQTDRDDVVLLSSPRYEPFFQNYGNWHDAARMIALPQQPGERPSPEQAARVVSEFPDALLMNYTIALVQNLAATHDRLWLLVDGTPELAWNTRPVEHYLSAHYHPIRALQIGDFTRLVEYSTVRAPDVFSFRDARHAADLAFGEHIRLLGVELPFGMTLQAGGVLPLSLYWQSDTPLQARYIMAVYLRDADGMPIAQHDSMPLGGFAPTDRWTPGRAVWDHRALVLPPDLLPGEYQLWVKVYDFAPDGSINDLRVTGSTVLDGVIGVLPVALTAAE